MFSEHLPSDEKELTAYVNKLADERIRYFEDKIKNEFGLSVRAGVELEFFGEKGKRVPYLSTSMLRDTIKDIPYVEDVKNDLGWVSHKAASPIVGAITAGGTLAAFSDEPSFAVFAGVFNGAVALLTRYFARQYEVTFSNKQEGKYASVADLANSVERTRDTLIQKAANFGVDTVSFESKKYPHTLHYQTAPSMHINLSLWSEDNKNVLKDADTHKACENALLDMQHEGGLLMLTTRNAYENLQKGYSPPKELKAGTKLKGKTLANRGMDEDSTRFEGRLPRADVNPHLALLGSVAALYDGLERAKNKTKEPEHTERSIPKDMYEAYNRFDESARCKELLGSELHEATLKLIDMDLSRDDIINLGTPEGHGAGR